MANFCSNIKKALIILFVLVSGTAYATSLGDRSSSLAFLRKKVITAQRFTALNGLPDDNIRCMAQDDDGFLWLGTLYGLYRFDGYTYRKYLRQTEGNRALLATNRVKAIQNVGKGMLQMRFNTDEMVDYDVKQDLFKPFKGAKEYVAKDRALKSKDIFFDNLGNKIQYDGNGGIRFYDKQTKREHYLKVLSAAVINATGDLKVTVVRDKRGLVWVSSNGGGLLIYNPQTGEERHVTSESGIIPSNYIVSMIMDTDGDIWTSSAWYGLTKLHLDRARYAYVPVGTDEKDDDEVKVVTQLKDGTLVLANNQGRVIGCNLPQGVIYNGIGELPNIPETRNQKQETTNGLWATTTKHGLWIKDHFILGTERTDRVLIDTKGRLWVTSINGLVAEAPLKGLLDGTAKLRFFFQDQKNFDVRAIVQISDGQIMLGTGAGLIAFYPDEFLKNPKKYTVYPLKEHTTETVRVTAIKEDSNHNLWVGTIVNGVFLGTKNKNSKKDSQLSTLRSSSAGLQGKNSQLEFRELGLNVAPNNNIEGFAEDRHGNMWIGTEGGMSCYNLKTGKTRYFSIEGNSMLNHANASCVKLLQNGKIAFGTIAGLVIVDENSIPPLQRQHTVRITDLYVNGQNVCDMPTDVSPIPQRSITDVKEICLPHDQNSITLHFSNMLYNVNGVTRYRYWLEGLETTWNEPTASNSASYQNLKPGKYIFHVDCFFDGDKTTEQQLVIVIEEPWWNTWWAYLIYITAIAIAIAIVSLELKQKYQLRKEAHEEHMLADFRIKFFTNISHEFRTPLTLILSSVDKLQKLQGLNGEMKKSVENMRHSTERMKRLIDQLLEFRKMEEGQLQLRVQKTDACAFVYQIWQQFQDVSENRNIKYEFLSSKKKIMCLLDRSYMDKVIYNLLSNAFKYTSLNGEISVSLEVKDERLEIVVTDNGVGVPEDKRATLFNSTVKSAVVGDSIGIGLKLTAELAREHHGDVRYEPNPTGGSIFTVILPIDEAAYPEQERMAEEGTVVAVGQEPSSRSSGASGAASIKGISWNDYAQIYPQQKNIELSSEPLNDKTVLIVEDDYDVLKLLQDELSKYFHIVLASNGEEAIAILENSLPSEGRAGGEAMPDLVITDYLMPKVNGMELLQHIRKSAYRYLPVIVLTAIDKEQTKLRGMQLGADAYVTKPFSMPLLVAQCVNLIKQRSYMLVTTGEDAVDGGAAARAAAEAQKMRLPEIISEERDKKLVDQMDRYIEAHIGDPDLNVDTMAEALGYRRTNFYKKISGLIGCSPKEYVRKRRIERVAELLQDDRYTVSEIAYKLGYSNPQYMSSVFKAYYGVRPSEYKKGS